MNDSGRAWQGRYLVERAMVGDGAALERDNATRLDPARSRAHTVNLADSPLGWLHARGHVSPRQFEAGERLRWDWERAQIDPQVTMRWDAAAAQRGRGGRASSHEPGPAQIDARARFGAAVEAVGPGLADIVWRIICAGEGMRQAETALGWPARAGKLVLGLALDRIADFYRMPQAGS